jgi:BMFP domain-containing protein YqiC
MIEEKTELWLELCAHAAIEQDPEKLRELARKINDLLAEGLNQLTNAQENRYRKVVRRDLNRDLN